ncbi:MAG: MBL fold metallo-hydrolase [Spirochaetes bacterium]|nr:MBL fold metallo-hydrolase [Spirochaetota bacterium]
MEVRITANSQETLKTRVFFSDESGFEVASVIVMGGKDAILIDAQWTLSNAHRVITEMLETGKNFTHIYITHAHPDHYFGVGTIHEVFPKARVVALPEDADMINRQFFGKIEHWENIIGSHNVCRKEANVEALKENFIDLEGHKLEIIPKVMGDMRYNSMVWIPSIKTLYASDVLFNQAHPFTCEVTAEERRQWVNEIDKIQKMGAEVIIPGHQKPGMQFDRSALDFTKDYLIKTEEVLASTDSVGEFYYKMNEYFSDANLMALSNEMNANVFKGNRDWNWRED